MNLTPRPPSLKARNAGREGGDVTGFTLWNKVVSYADFAAGEETPVSISKQTDAYTRQQSNESPLPVSGGGRGVSKAVFLDRDGVLNRDTGYISAPEQLEVFPETGRNVARLNVEGWKTFIFTNQSGVARGYMTADDLTAVHAELLRQIAADGGTIEEIYFCPHGPDDACDCRKPKPALLFRAATEHGINLAASVVIGDTARDIAAAKAAGCRGLLVLSGQTETYDAAMWPEPKPDHVFASLTEAVSWLVAGSSAGVCTGY